MTANTQAETKSISMEYDLPHAPAMVWRALTESDLLAHWLMANDMKPRVGQSFTFRSKPMPWWDGIVNCEVLAAEPNKRLSYTWQSGPESSPLDTVVTFTLTPTKSGGTKLALEQTGFPPSNANAYDGALQGWRRMIGEGLTAVLGRMA